MLLPRSLVFENAVSQVEAWLDGDGAAFVERCASKSADRPQPAAWEFSIEHPAFGTTNAWLVLPDEFPAAQVQILLHEDMCLRLPHVEETGKVCLPNLLQADDFENPNEAVKRTVTAFDEFLRNCEDPDWIAEEFCKEAQSYWVRFCSSNRTKARRGKQDSAIRVGHLWSKPLIQCTTGSAAIYADGACVLCLGAADPTDIARRHRIDKGTVRMAEVLYVDVPIGRAWTPAIWPRSRAALALLVDEITGHSKCFGDWFESLGSSKRKARHVREPRQGLVVFVQGGVAYGVQVFTAAQTIQGLPEVLPFNVRRIDPAWSLARDQKLHKIEALRGKRLLVIGCGSLGSPLIELLARSGVGHMDIVDDQDFASENCARHILGATSIGLKKATQLAARLTVEVPGAMVKGIVDKAVKWLCTECKPGNYDMVIECTGESTVRMALTRMQRYAVGDVPVAYAWLEPFCSAAHVVLTTGFDQWPTHDPADELVNVAAWPDGSGLVEIPACGSGFQPYGASDVWQAAGFSAERILSVLGTKAPEATVWSWMRTRAFFDSLGIKVEPRDIVPKHGGQLDSVTTTRRLKDVLGAHG